MLSSASMRKRSTSSRALVRAMLSFEKYVTAMMVKKTGTVRKKNAVRMLGLSRRLFLKMYLMGGPSWGTIHSTSWAIQGPRRRSQRPEQIPNWRINFLPSAAGEVSASHADGGV